MNKSYVRESSATRTCHCGDTGEVYQVALRDVIAVRGKFRWEGGIPETLERMFLQKHQTVV